MASARRIAAEEPQGSPASHVHRLPTGLPAAPPVMALLPEHLPHALELSRALDWPYRLEDWDFAFSLGRGFAVEIDGTLAGTALWWPYCHDYASAGMIIVSKQHQRMGIGGALMEALLEDAGERAIILNSTSEGLALYTRLGFVPYGHVNQHQAVLASPPCVEGAGLIRRAMPADGVAIYELDLAASGMDRRPLINALLTSGDFHLFERGGRVRGYGCVRTWGRGSVVGPVVAEDGDGARLLIAALAGSRSGDFVRIDVPEEFGLSSWLESTGLPQVNQVVSMALRGRPPMSASVRLFALSNQSLG